MNGKDWIKKETNNHLKNFFPRKVKSNYIVPKGLKPNTDYISLGTMKHGNRYYLIILIGKKEIVWSAEHFIIGK